VKVLILIDCLDNGGLERQMALAATNLPPEWRPLVWSMEHGPFEPYLRERGVPVTVRERRLRLDPLPGLRLWRDLAAWRPDVVHAWSWISALAAGPACRALRIPFVDGMIQSGALEPDHTALKRFGMACATLVVANTQAGLDAWGIGPERGRVVHNGFDAARLAAVADGGRQRDDGRFTVIMTGRMVPVKHYDVVIEAARRLSRVADGWRFLLVGDGPDRARLTSSARGLTAAGVVEFPEPGMEVLGLVRDADAGVLMTDPAYAYEGLSNSIMEYMALRLPVVCGDGGGNPELVVDGVTGFIVPPGDPAALTGRLAYLRDHPGERAAMGAAGRARIDGEFSLPRMVARMVEVYAEAVEREPAPR
jgi:glycosyltransferase involved in cell wall biosynthesis